MILPVDYMMRGMIQKLYETKLKLRNKPPTIMVVVDEGLVITHIGERSFH